MAWKMKVIIIAAAATAAAILVTTEDEFERWLYKVFGNRSKRRRKSGKKGKEGD